MYTIVLFEKSTSEFHAFPYDYIHYTKQQSNTGLKLELLQEFIFLPLDIFLENMHNKGICNDLDAWLAFFSSDEPEIVAELCENYPWFKEMYKELYELCQNTERVMEMFSKELLELDRNTVQYMIDLLQDTVDEQKDTIDGQKDTINEQKDIITRQQNIINENQKLLAELQAEIQQLKKS